MASFLFYQLEYKILFDVDCVDRAELLTAEAADTFVRVNLCFLFALLITDDLNGMNRAGAFTFAASDTGR